MIRYRLHCAQGHEFDGWYPSSGAYDRLAAAGQVGCPLCGSTRIDKALMTPALPPGGDNPSPGERALRALRHHLETESDDVGARFAAEARAMHEGDIPERPIHGEARPDEARALLEDGIPVLPLPFAPRRRQN